MESHLGHCTFVHCTLRWRYNLLGNRMGVCYLDFESTGSRGKCLSPLGTISTWPPLRKIFVNSRNGGAKSSRVTYLRISGGLAEAQKGSWSSAGAPSLSQLSTTSAIPSSLQKLTATLLRVSPRITATLPPRDSKFLFVFMLFFSAFRYDQSGVGMILSSLMKAWT